MPEVHHVVLDTSPLGFITIGKYRSNDVFDFFTGGTRAEHNALDDALQCLTVAHSVRIIFDMALQD